MRFCFASALTLNVENIDCQMPEWLCFRSILGDCLGNLLFFAQIVNISTGMKSNSG